MNTMDQKAPLLIAANDSKVEDAGLLGPCVVRRYLDASEIVL